MTKKRDPIVSVLEYFETSELPLAQQALELAKAVLRRRTPTRVAPKVKSKPKVNATGASQPTAN